MRSTLLGLALFLGVSGCDDGIDFKKIVGSYDAKLTVFGQTDQNILTLSEGSHSTLLFSFTTGLHADPAGPSPNGIRANLSGDKLKIVTQPAYLDHANGTSEGLINGSGTLTIVKPNKLEATLTFYTKDTFDFIQPNDGGVPTQTDMGSAVTIEVKATQQ